MYNINLEWKSFKVFLPDVSAWARMECGEHFCGISANSKLELHFTDKPSDLVEQKVISMWDQMSEALEASKLDSEAHKIKAQKYALDNLPYADFNSLIPAEKKLWMSQPLTESDRNALVAKYPNL